MVVSIVSLGCAKNLVDSERMQHLLREGGYVLAQDPSEAELVIINTCGFIKTAKEEAIDSIVEMVALKKERAIKHIVVTGCLAERYRDEVAELFPEVDAVVGIGNEKDICAVLDRVTAGERVAEFAPKCEQMLTGGRVLATLPFLAYLKIAEGCSNGCAYCAIPQIRGKFRSVPMEDVLAEAKLLAEGGVRELIVIAQDTTRYGEDLYGESRLPELLHKLCEIDGLRWIRVLYCYPERITDELIDAIASEEKIVKYLDIPIQHCNGRILKAMRREGDGEMLRGLFAKLRSRIPNITLRTTLLVGFPGETEEDFNELSAFAEEMRFDRMGSFAYSEEEGTLAEKMEGQVDEEIRLHRAELLSEQQMRIMEQLNRARIGTVTEAVIEAYDKWGECYIARTPADAPDIDGNLLLAGEAGAYEIGQFVRARITDAADCDVLGEVVEA